MLQSYISNRKQRTKINDAYGKYCEILFGVPQGSILEPLPFNIYYVICFMIITIAKLRIMLMIKLLRKKQQFRHSNKQTRGKPNNLFQWFRNNHVKANTDKCHFLVTGNYGASENVNEFEIEGNKKER